MSISIHIITITCYDRRYFPSKPPNFQEMRMVWLSSGNQVEFEIFEYIDSKAERRTNDNFEYWKSGFFHICITDPNIEGSKLSTMLK